LRHIQYRRTASLRAMATLAIFRPRRIARWKNLLRHSGMLRTVTKPARMPARLHPHAHLHPLGREITVERFASHGAAVAVPGTSQSPYPQTQFAESPGGN